MTVASMELRKKLVRMIRRHSACSASSRVESRKGTGVAAASHLLRADRCVGSNGGWPVAPRADPSLLPVWPTALPYPRSHIMPISTENPNPRYDVKNASGLTNNLAKRRLFVYLLAVISEPNVSCRDETLAKYVFLGRGGPTKKVT